MDYSFEDNIQFSINNDLGWQGLPGKYGNDGNNWDKIDSGERRAVKPFVNAVEIDWNSAIIGEG